MLLTSEYLFPFLQTQVLYHHNICFDYICIQLALSGIIEVFCLHNIRFHYICLQLALIVFFLLPLAGRLIHLNGRGNVLIYPLGKLTSQQG